MDPVGYNQIGAASVSGICPSNVSVQSEVDWQAFAHIATGEGQERGIEHG
jgi:hypothetical protein